MLTNSKSIQTLATGEELKIHHYGFGGTRPGPRIYLEANVHGPEILGTAVLLRAMEWLAVEERAGRLMGSVVVVPCANPMGAQAVAYNGMVGRWNATSGNNWNRIFSTPDRWKNGDEERAYYTEMLAGPNLSIEKKLAATLRLLSAGATYVLDLHTTGFESVEHLFTYTWASESFRALGTPIHIHLDGVAQIGSFDESHVIPYLARDDAQLPVVATWETYCHGHIKESVVQDRCTKLIAWLAEVLYGKPADFRPTYESYSTERHLQAPLGGYYSWLVKPGLRVKKGDAYALVYSPSAAREPRTALAEFDFTLLGIYGAGAAAAHEQIGVGAIPSTP